MTKVIDCPCGEHIRGESDEEVLAATHRHMDESHPDRSQTPSDAELLSSARDE